MKRWISMLALLLIVLLALSLVGCQGSIPATTKPTSTEKPWPELPVPEEGEEVYLGSAVYEKTGPLQVALVRTSDGNELHTIEYYLDHLKFEYASGSSIKEISIIKQTSIFPIKYTIVDGEDVSLPGIQLLGLTFDGNSAKATLNFTYNYTDSDSRRVEIPLGTSPITFTKQVPVAEAGEVEGS